MFELWVETRWFCQHRGTLRLIADANDLGMAIRNTETDVTDYWIIYREAK
jgi:hypothetical protein